LYLFEFSYFFTTSFEVYILLPKLDIWTISSILYRDLELWPIVDIAISFFVYLGSDEFLCFFFCDSIEVDTSWNIDIERLPLEEWTESSLPLGVWLTIVVSYWCISELLLFDEFDGTFTVDCMCILTARYRYECISPLDIRPESSLSK
jgi:hypothetical protein